MSKKKPQPDPRSLLSLDAGLELWKVRVDDLIEQDKNARAMSPAAFDRLENTVKRDKRLEALPFCALTERGVEVVSGHHRTRAARAGGVEELYVLVDVTGLSRAQITAKQLAHNSISGRDDPQLVKELYESIEDVDSRLEAFIDPKDLGIDLESLSVGDVSVDFASRVIQITFLTSELDRWEQALEEIKQRFNPDAETMYVAELERLDQFNKLLRETSAALEVKAFGSILGACADIVFEALGVDQGPDEQTDRVHLSQVVKQAYLPREAAETIGRALDRMTDDGDLTDKNRWQGLEYMAAEYLSGSYAREAEGAAQP